MLLFFKEIKGFIGLFLINQILLWLLFFISDLSKIEILLYFTLLSFLSVFFFFLFYFLKRKKFFSFLSRKELLHQQDLGETPLAQAFSKKLDANYTQSQKQLDYYQKSHEEHLLFINKWVHYIKTPLSVIRVITQENEDQEPLLQIQTESEKILHGVNMALYFARSSNFANDFKFEQLNLKTTIQEIINELKRFIIKKGVYPSLAIEDDCFVYSDKKWLKFIIYQLVTNAVQYSFKGNKIHVFTKKENHLLWICVKDTGKGIPSQEKNRIFDLFFTGTNGRAYGESTGIGLYLVQKICNKMGYPIQLESEENKGSIFSIGILNNSPHYSSE